MSEPNHTPNAAALLRKGQRLSLAGSRGLSSRRASGSLDQGKRRSTLLSTPAQNKRTSIQSGSNYGSNFSNNIGTEPSTSALSTPYAVHAQAHAQAHALAQAQAPPHVPPPRRSDPRPLRDKNYQSMISTEVYEFCVGNRFELETGHVITPKTLRQPTQKDFVVIFSFLYGKIDPNHEYMRSVEADVYPILKDLGYPYLDGINRSSIGAVGGQNWPVFLGMLYWLVKLIINTPELTDEQLLAPEDSFDHIFIKYITKSYSAFREGNEDYSEFYSDMVREYNEAKALLDQQIEATRQEGEQLAAECRAAEEQLRAIEEAREKSRALENDYRSFSAYMAKVKERQQQWDGILAQLEADVAEAQSKTEEAESTCRELLAAVEARGTSVAEIDALEAEKERAAKVQAELSNKLDEQNEKLASKKRELQQGLQSLQRFVEEYNAKVANIPSSQNESFELSLRPNLVSDECLAFSSDEIFDKVLRDEKVKLLDIRAHLKSETKRVQGETEVVAEQADRLAEQISEYRSKIQSETAEKVKAQEQYEELHENMERRKAEWVLKIENRERMLREMEIKNNDSIIELQTRNKELLMQRDEEKFQLQRMREQYYTEVTNDVRNVLDFKEYIQDQLESLNLSVKAELEEELRRGSVEARDLLRIESSQTPGASGRSETPRDPEEPSGAQP